MKIVKTIRITAMVALLVSAASAQDKPNQPNGGSAPSGASPLLVIDSFTHDFGEVTAGTPLRFAFKVKNEGKADLLINAVNPSCGCTKGEFDKVVPPGKEGKIELAVEHTEGYAGEVAKSANVLTNDPKLSTFNLVLRARFAMDKASGAAAAPPAPPPLNPRSVLAVEPSDRWVTSALAGSSASNTLYLYNPQAAPVHAKQIVPGGTEFTATLQTIQDGKRYQLNVTSNPALKPGHYTRTLKVATDSTVQPEVAIEIDLTVYPKVFASPTSIIMPPLPANAPDLLTINWPMIYVRKIREQGLKIKSYSSTVPFIKLELLTETEGQVYKIRLTLDQPKIKPGGFSGKIHIETNDADVPVIDIPIKGTFN